VVFTEEVAGPAPNEARGSMAIAGNAAIPISSLRRNADCRPGLISSDMSTPLWFENALICQARIAEIVHRTDT
jgi:hypothetical protein